MAMSGRKEKSGKVAGREGGRRVGEGVRLRSGDFCGALALCWYAFFSVASAASAAIGVCVN